MKKPIVAFTLSFLLPGAGLAYLGKWKWAAINFGIVLLVGIILAVSVPEGILDPYFRYIAIGFSAGSASIAQTMAQQINAKLKQAQPIAAAEAGTSGQRG